MGILDALLPHDTENLKRLNSYLGSLYTGPGGDVFKEAAARATGPLYSEMQESPAASYRTEPIRKMPFEGDIPDPFAGWPEGVRTDPYGNKAYVNREGNLYSDPDGLKSLRSFLAKKYKMPEEDVVYGGAGGEAANLSMQTLNSRLRTASLIAKENPGLSVDEIFKNVVEKPTEELRAKTAATLKEFAAIEEPERQRRENAYLMEILAQTAGIDVPEAEEGISAGGMKTFQNTIEQGRARRNEQRADATLALRQQQAGARVPAEATINGLAQEILNRAGYDARQTQRGWDVYKPRSNTPLLDSPQRWAAARKIALEKLTRKE